jgi:hypothetical protein
MPRQPTYCCTERETNAESMRPQHLQLRACRANSNHGGVLTLWHDRDRCHIAAQLYLTKLRYEASASISFEPRWLATIGIGDSVPE